MIETRTCQQTWEIALFGAGILSEHLCSFFAQLAAKVNVPRVGEENRINSRKKTVDYRKAATSSQFGAAYEMDRCRTWGPGQK